MYHGCALPCQPAIALCNGVRGLKCSITYRAGHGGLIALCNGVRGLKFGVVTVRTVLVIHRTL